MVSLVRPRTAVVVLSALAAVVVYAAMWLGYRQGWGWLGWVDSSSLHALYDVGIKHPSWVRFWEIVSAAFGPTVFRLLGAVAVVVALVKRNLRAVLFLLVSIQFSGRVELVAKDLAVDVLRTDKSAGFQPVLRAGAVIPRGFLLVPASRIPRSPRATGRLHRRFDCPH